jgi:cytochrome c-type biogenesis protein
MDPRPRNNREVARIMDVRPRDSREVARILGGGMSFAGVAANGPLVLAAGAAATAGLVSFLSPCVLPLVPGYLSYMTGLAGADLDATVDGDGPGRSRVVGRVLAGTLLFIAGFAVIFTLSIVAAASLGHTLRWHERTVDVIVGIFVIVLGAAFLGLIPGMQREWRIRKLPSAGLLGAPVLGAVFALSWAPCIGPTLGAVMSMSLAGGQTGRAVLLSVAYCLGLGLPFLIFGLGFRRLIGVFRVIRRNSRWVTRVGGGLLIVIGFALVADAWEPFLVWLRSSFGTGSVGI